MTAPLPRALACALLAALTAAPGGQALALNLEVVTNHRGTDFSGVEFRDNDSQLATPIAPGTSVFAASIGSGYAVRSSADALGNSAVDMTVTSVFGDEWVDLAIVDADAVHTNVFGSAARARFSFFLPVIDVAATAANATLLYQIQITRDFSTVWAHQGVMDFDLVTGLSWHWTGEDIGAPAPGAVSSIHIEGAFGTADLGIVGPGESFRLGVEKVIQLEKKPGGGFVEGAFMAIGDPDDLSLSPFLGAVTFTPLASAPEPRTLVLLVLALAGTLVRRRGRRATPVPLRS